MKHQKELLERPWLFKEPELAERVQWQVETAQFNHRGLRMLEVRFYYNRNHLTWEAERYDFRVFLKKTAGEFIVQFRDKISRCDLRGAMGRTKYCGTPLSCYPWMEQKDEERIARVLGTSKTRNHQMDNLDRWMREQLERDLQARRAAAGYIPDEWVSRCPEALPEGLETYIRQTVLPEDDVLAYQKGGVRGTCFRCGRQVRSRGQRFKQHEIVRCPDCGEEVLCVLEGGDSWRADYTANVAFCQRGTDGETVFVRHFHLRRDPSARYERPADWLTECARYAFRGNQAAMWQKERKESCLLGRSPVYRLAAWTRSRRFCVYDGSYYFMEDGAEEAFRGTRLEYCQLHEYVTHLRPGETNPIRYLYEFTRCPVLEFLWKAGYRQVADDKVRGWLSQGNRNCLRWQAKTVRSAFPFPMRLLKLKEPLDWDCAALQRVKNLLSIRAMTDQEIGLLLEDKTSEEFLRAVLPYMTVKQFLRYKREQGEDVIRLYKDYLAECRKLELDLRDKAVLFPPNLRAAHERTAAMVQYEAHKEEMEAFAAQVKGLEQWSWEQDGLLIRPAASMTELKEEGAALHHCVAGYGSDMAHGKTAIFLVRRSAEPDKPFYTLELQDKEIVQCRTSHNASAAVQNPEVQTFAEAWLEQVVKKPIKKKKGTAA